MSLGQNKNNFIPNEKSLGILSFVHTERGSTNRSLQLQYGVPKCDNSNKSYELPTFCGITYTNFYCHLERVHTVIAN